MVWLVALQNLDILQAIHEALLRNNFIKPPRVRIMPQNGEASGQLQDIVHTLKGHVVSDDGTDARTLVAVFWGLFFGPFTIGHISSF